MTAVRIADSLKYGAVLFGYFLVIGVVGVGGMALGGTLALPELESFIDDTGYETAELVGGFVLGTLGFAVWTGGLFALAHKLIADSVARGQADVSVTLSESGESVAATRTVTGLEGSTNGSDVVEHADQPAASQRGDDANPHQHGEADQPNVADERGWSGNWSQPETTADSTDAAERQPERSAEEIAFGSGSETAEATGPDSSVADSTPADGSESSEGEQFEADPESQTRSADQSETASEDGTTDEQSERDTDHSETADNDSEREPQHSGTADDPLADREDTE